MFLLLCKSEDGKWWAQGATFNATVYKSFNAAKLVGRQFKREGFAVKYKVVDIK